MTTYVPKPELTQERKESIAIESAYLELVRVARIYDFNLIPQPMGLMYCPDHTVIKEFQQLCRKILHVLRDTEEPPQELLTDKTTG